MTAPNDSILNKIRGLMAKAAATEFPAEAEAFAAKAAELMARHSVEAAMLADQTGTDDDPLGRQIIILENPYAKMKALLLHIIAENLNGSMLMAQGHDGLASRGLVYGRQSDLERIEFLYTSLIVQAVRLVVATKTMDYAASSVAAYRRAWLQGFAVRIGERLAAGKAEATRAAGSGAELVLRDRYAVAHQTMGQAHPKTQSMTVSSSRRDGYNAGQNAANRADLGQARVGGHRAAVNA